MGYNITKPITVNGFTNLYAVLKTAGYNGAARLETGATLFNDDGAIITYIHFNDSSATPPSTGTDGIPFGAASSSSPSFTLPAKTDLSTVWLYAASSVSIKAAVQS